MCLKQNRVLSQCVCYYLLTTFNSRSSLVKESKYEACSKTFNRQEKKNKFTSCGSNNDDDNEHLAMVGNHGKRKTLKSGEARCVDVHLDDEATVALNDMMHNACHFDRNTCARCESNRHRAIVTNQAQRTAAQRHCCLAMSSHQTS